jgi:hypothetical protein
LCLDMPPVTVALREGRATSRALRLGAEDLCVLRNDNGKGKRGMWNRPRVSNLVARYTAEFGAYAMKYVAVLFVFVLSLSGAIWGADAPVGLGGDAITKTNCPQPSVCSLVTCPTSTNWVNPMNAPYDAAGNGVTDDTAAIQAANNAGDVCFPSGHTFLITVPGSGASINISQNNKHWQAGMIGGAAPILKQSGVPSSCSASNDQCFLTLITSSGGSLIGLDFEGPYHNSTSTYNEWDLAVRANGAANNWLAAGNIFNGFGGDGEIELYGGNSATPCITGWHVAYNSFNWTGNYGFVVVAGQNNAADHNTTLEGAEGVENDNTNQCTGGNTFDNELVTANVGAAWQRSTGRNHYTCLTGGCTAANYSGNTVSNSIVTGTQSCICINNGATPATYANNTCTSACQTR